MLRRVLTLFLLPPILGVAFTFILTCSASAQVSPAEHAKHHPQAAGGQANPSGGMMAQMGEMMKNMGVPPKKELYPTLISLTALPEERRHELHVDAQGRINEGLSLLIRALGVMNQTEVTGDTAALDEATEDLRQAAAIYSSGVSTLRAIESGEQPKEIALRWFKSQMNLPRPVLATPDEKMSLFHLSIMIFLVCFTIILTLLHVLKMHRAALLLKRLAVPGALGVPPIKVEAANVTIPAAVPVEQKFPAPVLASPITSDERWTGELLVGGKFVETPTIKTFRLISPSGGEIPFSFLCGQFVTLAIDIDGKSVKRSYSIASSPTQRRYIDLTIRRQEGGKLSPYLHDVVKTGDRLRVSGPSGVFTFIGTEAPAIILIGAGVGITPLMSSIRFLTDTCWKGSITLFWSCRNPSEYLFGRELEELQAHFPNFRHFVSMTRPEGTGWSGLRGRVSEEAIKLCFPEVTTTRIHLCGPISMMDSVKAFLLDLGVPKALIKSEAFGPEKKDEAPDLVKRAVGENIVSTTTKALFSKSDKEAFLPPSMTILEAAESVGVEIENSCRVGTCGLCKVRLVNGEVTMACDDALSEQDKKKGIILACQAKATANVTVEA